MKNFPENECRFAIFDLVLKVEDELTEYKGNKVRKNIRITQTLNVLKSRRVKWFSSAGSQWELQQDKKCMLPHLKVVLVEILYFIYYKL